MDGGDLIHTNKNQGDNGGKKDEESVGPCLIRRGEPRDCKELPPNVVLLNKPHVTIGRGYNVDCCVLSQMVSRLHCVIKSCTDGGDDWELVDRSGNGVFINGKKVEKDVGFQLHDGDVINLSSATDPPASYEFKGKTANEKTSDKDCKEQEPELVESFPIKPAEELEPSPESANNPVVCNRQYTNECSSNTNCRRRKHEIQSAEDYVEILSADDPVDSKVFKSNSNHKQSSDSSCKRLKSEFQLPEPTQSTSVATESTDEPAQDPQRNLTPERLKLRQKNIDLADELEKMRDVMKQQEMALRQQWELEQEEKKKAEEVQAEARKKDEASEKEKWQQWLAELNAKHEMALEEKNQLADRLRSMDDDKSKEAEIEKEKAQLEIELKTKDSECFLMKQRLDELTSRNKESAALAIKMRDDVIKNVNETMETELQCSICSELFVKAATLNCAHSYCSSCINEWMQKKLECPICRAKIKSIAPSLVLDNFIDKIVDTLDTSMKERRKELLEERSKLPVAKLPVIVNPVATAQPQPVANRGQRARSRAARRGAPPRRAAAVHTQPVILPVPLPQGGAPLRGAAPMHTQAVNIQGTTTRIYPINFPVVGLGVSNRPPLRSLLEAPPNNPHGITVRHINNYIRVLANNNPVRLPPNNPPVSAPPNNPPARAPQNNHPARAPQNNHPARAAQNNHPARAPQNNLSGSAAPNNPPARTFSNNPTGRAHDALPAGVQPIVISSDTESQSDDGDVEGPVGYYGGYGHCYRCGAQDHWSNGCPF